MKVLPMLLMAGLSLVLMSPELKAAERRTLADIENIESQSFIDSIPELSGNSSAIFEYRKFLQVSAKGSALRRQVLVRLAEIELALAEKLLADEIPAQATDQSEQVLDVNQSIASSIYLFETALKEYPEHADNDRVLYQLARAYDVNAKPEQRVDALDRLVKTFVNSGYYNEAQFRLAEYYFVSRQYKAAAQAYGEVLKAETEFADNALYKRGWSYFKLADYTRALDDFVAVLDKYGVSDLETASRIEKELYQDSLRVISLGFAYLQGVESVNKYFATRKDAHYIKDIYYSLGQHYLEKKRFADTVEAYMAFADHYPQSRHAPTLVLESIVIWQKSQLPAKVLQAREIFAKRYALKSAYWTTHKTADFPAVIEALRENIYLLAEYHHSLGQKLKSNAEKDKAVHWYAEFIQSFPADAKTPHMHFLYAELLSELGRNELSYAAYNLAAYHYGMKKDSAESAYAAILAAMKLADLTTKQVEKNKQWQQAVVSSTLKFAESFPQDKRVLNSLLHVAELQYKQGRMLESIALAEKILPRASEEQKKKALLILGHSQFELELYSEAEKNYQQLLKLTGSKHKDYKEIRKRIAISIYKEGELARKAGDSKAAVAAFLRVRLAVPESPVVVTAEYDAAVELIKANQWQQAIPVMTRFRKSYPGHKWQNEITAKLAVAYTETAQFSKAAAEYGLMAGFVVDKEQKRVAYYQVAELYEKDGKVQEALKAYQAYLSKYTQPFDIAMEVRQKLIELYGKAKDTKQQNQWRERIILADKKAGKQRTERSKYLAAGAAMALADNKNSEYSWIKLKAPFKKNLGLKKARMKKAVDAFAEVLKYQLAATTTEAVYKIGEIYNNFSKSLIKSERPGKLSALELEQYNILLEEQAFPFDEKAIEFHQSNLNRAKDNIYDKWIEKSVQRLSELYPGRYLRKEKLEDVIDVQ